MSRHFFKFNFHVAVSDKREHKLGSNGTMQTQPRQIFYYAEKSNDKKLFIQPLNGNNYPSGQQIHISFDAFMKNYRPEPLFYYNKVKPVIDAVNKDLESAERHLENNRPEKAERAYKSVLAVDSDNIRAIFGLGITYLVAENFEDAEYIFTKIMGLELAFSQEHTHLFNKFGIRMRKSGLLNQAIEYYNKAIQLNADDEHLHFNVSRVHFEQCDYAKSYQCIRAALTVNPHFNEGMLMLRALDRVCGNLPLDTPPECTSEAPSIPTPARDYSGLDLDNAPWEA